MKIEKLREILAILEEKHPDIDVKLNLDSKEIPNFFELWKELRNTGLSCFMETTAGSDCQITVV